MLLLRRTIGVLEWQPVGIGAQGRPCPNMRQAGSAMVYGGYQAGRPRPASPAKIEKNRTV